MTIKEVIKFFRNLDVGEFEYHERKALREKLRAMGFTQIGTGAYAYVYTVDGFVVKIACQSFERLRGARRNPVFRRYAPPIYYMHKSGKIIVCKHVEFKECSSYSESFRRAAIRIEAVLRRAGFNARDLHCQNLVKCGRRWQLIDYGSWFGNDCDED